MIVALHGWNKGAVGNASCRRLWQHWHRITGLTVSSLRSSCVSPHRMGQKSLIPRNGPFFLLSPPQHSPPSASACSTGMLLAKACLGAEIEAISVEWMNASLNELYVLWTMPLSTLPWLIFNQHPQILQTGWLSMCMNGWAYAGSNVSWVASDKESQLLGADEDSGGVSRILRSWLYLLLWLFQCPLSAGLLSCSSQHSKLRWNNPK